MHKNTTQKVPIHSTRLRVVAVNGIMRYRKA